jgi:hypothetical protein
VCITPVFQILDFDERQELNRFFLRNIMAYHDCQRVYLEVVNPYDMNDFFDALIQGQFPLMKDIELAVSVLLLALCTFAKVTKK